ncbi:MAG: hypothetical protein FWB79_06695 [Treponema sp.]|nr:hypothetical protein [Treponema sp.]
MKIPPRILKEFGEFSRGLEFGKAALELHFKQGKPRVVVNAEVSFHLTQEELEEMFQLEGKHEQA